MKIYNYNSKTGEYTGEGNAQVSPKEPGKYLIPAHATEDKPPTPGEHEAAVWQGGAWQIIGDWRGSKGYVSGEPTEIEELGPLPDGWSETPPEPTLEEAKENKKKELADARWRDEVGGIVIDGVRMYTDRESQAKYTGAVVTYTAKGVWPPSWKGMDGWLTLPDGNALMDLAEAVEMHVAGLFVREEALSKQVDAAETVEEVQAISWQAGNTDG